jgi:hypothetical protein
MIRYTMQILYLTFSHVIYLIKYKQNTVLHIIDYVYFL